MFGVKTPGRMGSVGGSVSVSDADEMTESTSESESVPTSRSISSSLSVACGALPLLRTTLFFLTIGLFALVLEAGGAERAATGIAVLHKGEWAPIERCMEQTKWHFVERREIKRSSERE